VTTEELKARAHSRYESTLKKLLLGENPFPVSVPYKRPKRAGDPTALLRLKAFLRTQSKTTNGFGPTIQFGEARTKKFGTGVLAGDIFFETLDDLTRYIGKKSEAERILAHAAIVTAEIPAARTWTARHFRKLGDKDASTWRGIVKAVHYFRENPKPWVYPREVPLGFHTKFLENNYSTIISLLLLTAPFALNDLHTNWQDRLGLRSSSEMVEGRFLDRTLAPELPQHMLASVTEWNRCAFTAQPWVLITENRTTFLTLPKLPRCLALLGKGYAVIRLAQIEKLASSSVVYWGDIDQHGFEILASLRSHLPQTVSCLMDAETFEGSNVAICTENVEGILASGFLEANLTEAEHGQWRKCAVNHLRLEQENIPNERSSLFLEQIAKALMGAGTNKT
jgi:hypothetical protein